MLKHERRVRRKRRPFGHYVGPVDPTTRPAGLLLPPL